jgi:hypothetical protein
MTYNVVTKSTNAYQAWTTRGSYGLEAAALAAAQRLSLTHAFVRVVDGEGRVLWSA